MLFGILSHFHALLLISAATVMDNSDSPRTASHLKLVLHVFLFIATMFSNYGSQISLCTNLAWCAMCAEVLGN